MISPLSKKKINYSYEMLHNKQYGGKKNSQYLKFSRGLISRAVCNRLIVKVINLKLRSP